MEGWNGCIENNEELALYFLNVLGHVRERIQHELGSISKRSLALLLPAIKNIKNYIDTII